LDILYRLQKKLILTFYETISHFDTLVVNLLFLLEEIEVEVPQLDGTIVEAAEEVGLGESKAEDETVATKSRHSRLLVAPNISELVDLAANSSASDQLNKNLIF
jgi:hypothetical protein